MTKVENLSGRRTTVDAVFDHLYEEIATMRMLPGTKISEAEIASQFNISRQPVRDAFSRLENLDLVLIRPQRATEVKRFSSEKIEAARFVRSAVETKVLTYAANACDAEGAKLLDQCIERQRVAVAVKDGEKFGALDYEFHRTLCSVANVEYAFDVIEREKAKIDRLCILSLARNDRLDLLLSDHITIAEKVKANDVEGAVEIGLLHLSRLDDAISMVRTANSDFFEG